MGCEDRRWINWLGIVFSGCLWYKWC
jgi:hypothetical protein